MAIALGKDCNKKYIDEDSFLSLVINRTGLDIENADQLTEMTTSSFGVSKPILIYNFSIIVRRSQIKTVM